MFYCPDFSRFLQTAADSTDTIRHDEIRHAVSIRRVGVSGANWSRAILTLDFSNFSIIIKYRYANSSTCALYNAKT